MMICLSAPMSLGAAIINAQQLGIPQYQSEVSAFCEVWR